MRPPRTGYRIPVALPAEIRWKNRKGGNRQMRGTTGNISGTGLFMAVPVRPRLETPITVKVILPTHVAKIPVELLCKGRVIRWNLPGEVPGLGATIDDYELRPAARPS